MASPASPDAAAARSSLVLNLQEAQVAQATGQFVDKDTKKDFGEMFFGMLQDIACVLGPDGDAGAEKLRRITVKFRSATYVATLVDQMAYIDRVDGSDVAGDAAAAAEDEEEEEEEENEVDEEEVEVEENGPGEEAAGQQGHEVEAEAEAEAVAGNDAAGAGEGGDAEGDGALAAGVQGAEGQGPGSE